MNDKSQQVNPTSLQGLLDHFVEATDGQEKVSIDELLKSLSSRSHGPMLLFPAFIAISPIGMIPGMSIVTGSLIIVIAAQMMIFSDRPWIPSRLATFEFSRCKLKNGVDKIRRWVEWFEKVVHNRLEFFASGIIVYPIAVLSILLAVTFYPLAVIPFGVLAPGFAITLFGLGLTARDGLLVLIGFALSALSGYVLWWTWPH